MGENTHIRKTNRVLQKAKYAIIARKVDISQKSAKLKCITIRCKQTVTNTNAVTTTNVTSDSVTNTNAVTTTNVTSDSDDGYVFSAKNEAIVHNSLPTCVVQIEGEPIRMTIDSGASVNIMDSNTFNKIRRPSNMLFKQPVWYGDYLFNIIVHYLHSTSL